MTDITSNASATGGDWENGGQPATTGASGLFGSWSPTLGTKPVNKNNWTLGPDADPIPATDAFGGTTTSFNEGYGAEVTWNTPGLKAYDPTTNTFVAVQPGHTYRVQSMTHDTDQNHTSGGGDVGEVCTTFSIPVAKLSITKTADASPVNAGDSIGFTVEIKNTGNADATGAKLNDPLPAGSGAGEVRPLRRQGQPDSLSRVVDRSEGRGLHDSHHGVDIGDGVRCVRQHRDADVDRLESASRQRGGGV